MKERGLDLIELMERARGVRMEFSLIAEGPLLSNFLSWV